MKLSTELSKRSTGKTLYILDEPTTGLSFEDTRALLDVLQRLVDGGNTVVVIEHHMDVMKNADHIIDLGPAGRRPRRASHRHGHAGGGRARRRERDGRVPPPHLAEGADRGCEERQAGSGAGDALVEWREGIEERRISERRQAQGRGEEEGRRGRALEALTADGRAHPSHP